MSVCSRSRQCQPLFVVSNVINAPYSRRVRFTPAAFQRSLVERPYLADSFNESSSPHMPTPSNMAFGVAAEVGDLETGQDLLDAMDAENTTINIRLRWDKEISNPDVREMFEKVKVATGRKVRRSV